MLAADSGLKLGASISRLNIAYQLCFALLRSQYSHMNVITELWNLPAVPRRSSAKAQQVSIPLAFYLYPEFRRGHGQRQFRAEVIRPEDYRESAR